MGAVYRAWHLSLDRAVAVKEMKPQPGLDADTLGQLRRQFQQEAEVLARLSHPNLVSVLDFFDEGGNAYLVMGLVEGEHLADCIEREGALPEGQALEWADQLLSALEHCHDRGVLHRDVKPQNIIVRPDGQVVLVDFGLVKLWDPDDPHTRTVMRGAGTPAYAPPEQYDAFGGHTDFRSDIYSVGATLYHALAGRMPPTASDRTASPELLVPIRDLNPRVSGETEAAVLKAMQLRLVDRFDSAAEMRAALKCGAATSEALPGQATKAMSRAHAVAPLHKRVPVWGWALGGVASVVFLVACASWALSTLIDKVAVPSLPGTTSPATSTYVPTRTPTLTPSPTSSPLPSSTLSPTPSPTSVPTFPPLPSLGDTWMRPADGMAMVYVPAGEFEMGSSDEEVEYALQLCDQYLESGGCTRERFENEQPAHAVALDGFWIDQTEVTNAQYRRCVEAGVCEPPGGSGFCVNHADGAYDNYPVACVNWRQAAAYCAWAGARLPTEAEWEYAARGPESLRYPWGNAFEGSRLNFCDVNCSSSWADGTTDDGYAFSAPVGNYPEGATWCGAWDLAGNISEWVADWYGDYPSGRQVDPPGPLSGEYRVVRGSSWGDYPGYARGANRAGRYPDDIFENLGFRCVQSPD
jgi:formylglycine-generating enzyme required for sulfatase activity